MFHFSYVPYRTGSGNISHIINNYVRTVGYWYCSYPPVYLVYLDLVENFRITSIHLFVYLQYQFVREYYLVIHLLTCEIVMVSHPTFLGK